MLKVSNETKVGALAAISITLLILGFNFLKGKNLFQKKAGMYVTFTKIEGLNVSDPIKINGLRVGSVEDMNESDADMNGVVVSFQLVRAINIPRDSYAQITSTPLGAASIIITLGKEKKYLQDGDTLKGIESIGLLDNLKTSIEPTVANINHTLATLDTAIKRISNVFDAHGQANLNKILTALAATTNNLNSMLEPGKGSLAATADNIKSITGNLKNNNDSITSIINNIAQTTHQLSSADIDKSIESLHDAADKLNVILANIKDGKGSMGKLANDEELYNNLNRTANSLNILLQDLRVHPKRYVNISVFGKKDKTGPLMSPLPDSTKK